jgi:hypothetical protein
LNDVEVVAVVSLGDDLHSGLESFTIEAVQDLRLLFALAVSIEKRMNKQKQNKMQPLRTKQSDFFKS